MNFGDIVYSTLWYSLVNRVNILYILFNLNRSKLYIFTLNSSMLAIASANKLLAVLLCVAFLFKDKKAKK